MTKAKGKGGEGAGGAGEGAQFTKADWRPGKRRASYPRKRAWGGAKVAPAAFVAMARLVGFGSEAAKARQCRHCRRPAMRGLPVCREHGGASHAARRRPFVARRHPDYERPAP